MGPFSTPISARGVGPLSPPISTEASMGLATGLTHVATPALALHRACPTQTVLMGSTRQYGPAQREGGVIGAPCGRLV